MGEYSKNPIKAWFQLIGDLLCLAAYHVEASIRWFGDRSARWVVNCRLTLLLGVGAVLGAIFVWPTLYRYDHTNVGSGQSVLVKINRFTGLTEILYPSGWHAAVSEQSNGGTFLKLTDTELKRLDGTARLELSHWFRLTLYNGTKVKIRAITVEIVVTNPTQNTAEGTTHRSYRMVSEYPIDPEQTGYFRQNLAIEIDPPQSWSWRIVAGEGISE